MNVTLLLLITDSRGVMQLPIDVNGASQGLFLDTAGQPPSKAIMKYLSELFDREFVRDDFGVFHSLSPMLSTKPSSVLYVARFKPEIKELVADKILSKPLSGIQWITMAGLMRSLAPGRDRVVYNKAFQVLAGVLEGDIAALEVDDEVRKRLKLDEP